MSADAERGTSWTRYVLPTAIVTLLVLGVALTIRLFRHLLDVYFFIWGPRPVATEADDVGFAWLVSSCLASLLLTFGLSLAVRKRWARIVAIFCVIPLILTLVLAYLYVGTGASRVQPEPSDPLPSNYEPCYSGSNECN